MSGRHGAPLQEDEQGMSRTDRAVYRALRHLAPDETLLTSAVGVENDGRRRQIVLVSNRRVIVAGLRHEPKVASTLTATSATFEPAGARLILERDEKTQAVVRNIEPAAARQIVALLAEHRRLPEDATAPRVQHVHIQHDEPDDSSGRGPSRGT